MSKMPGIGKWRPTGRTIGGGGQSQIHEVEPEGNLVTPGKYAMKVLRRAASLQAVERFRREIEAIQTIKDKRIVEILDADWSAAEVPYYVMPLYDDYKPLSDFGLSKESSFKGSALTALEFIASCAEALTAVHDAKVIHRDISPGNVLVHPSSNEPLILDFGCCLILDNKETITLVDEGVGTKDYMAPECEPGAPGEITPRTDVYSLGKLLWSLVTGERAFARERPAFDNKRLSKMLPDKPDTWHLTDILLKSVRHDPRNRYPDAKALAEDARSAARKIRQGVLPIEAVAGKCTICGAQEIKEGRFRNDMQANMYPIDAGVLLGSPSNNPDAVVVFCNRCGYVVIRDKRPVQRYVDTLNNAERGGQ